MDEFMPVKKGKRISKKIILIIITVVTILLGTTYAFYNYARVGNSNTIAVGRIHFTSSEGTAINLTNVFPITSVEAETDTENSGTVTINVTGDTTYATGIEYLISAVDVNNVANGKEIPINIMVTASNLGTSDDNYFTNRGGNTNIYKIVNNKIKENGQIVAGYIKSGATGINGSITIKAYIDADQMAITDTYTGTSTGTSSEWVDGRIVFTRSEWLSFSTTGVSFKIKVEANEGVWVEEEGAYYSILKKNADTTTLINFANISSSFNGEGLYRLPGTENDTYPIYYYRGAINNNNVIFGGYCWQMVRTTSTGGIKMIYNGSPDISGSGDNITYNCGVTREIQNTIRKTVNLNYSTGYYYADDYEIVDTRGNGALYKLKSNNNPITQVAISNATAAATNVPVIAENYPYTCLKTSSTETCEILYKVISYNSGTNANVYPSTDISVIDRSEFSSYSTSAADVGYMNNARFFVTTNPPSNGDIFGKNVEWNGTNYLVIEDTSGTPSTNTTIDNYHHYTCVNSGVTTCSNVRYYYYNSGTVYYGLTLSGGDFIEDALYKMTGNGNAATKTKNNGYDLNVNDSRAKIVIDNWFRTHLTNEANVNNPNYSTYLEDTEFCNDRSYKTIVGDTNRPIMTESGWNIGGNIADYILSFGTYNRYQNNWFSTENVPSMTCPNETDRFTVSENIGNGKLTYPVGLLTADEIILAGASTTDVVVNNYSFYLYTGDKYWSLSPNSVGYNGLAFTNYINVSSISNTTASTIFGIRPVISLKLGTEFESDGDGTPTNPYVVIYN